MLKSKTVILNSKFDFLFDSAYKLHKFNILYEKQVEELNQARRNSVDPSALPAFLKLRESKNDFYNSIYSIKHLYEQNKQKVKRTCLKLKEESFLSDMLLETFSHLFVGTWSLMYIEFMMNKFLGASGEYENYLNKVASYSDRYSNHIDVLKYYMSLTNVYRDLSKSYYSQLNYLDTFGAETSGKANEISSYLLQVISKLGELEDELNKITIESKSMREAIRKLQESGFTCSFKAVKTKYYVETLLQDIINEDGNKYVKSQPLHVQINVIRNKIVLLRILDQKVNRS